MIQGIYLRNTIWSIFQKKDANSSIRNLLQEFVHSKQKVCPGRNMNFKGKLAVAIIHDYEKPKNFL